MTLGRFLIKNKKKLGLMIEPKGDTNINEERSGRVTLQDNLHLTI